VKCLKKRNVSSPDRLLKRMERHIRDEGLRSSDEAWLVLDRDSWSEDQLLELVAWAASDRRFSVAISNPKFEVWLLMHFEDPAGATTPAVVDGRLRACLPEYDKDIQPSKFTPQSVMDAISRAKMRDTPQCIDWPRNPPGTTVYRLAERIISLRT
jgi:hypothetical protein